ncbi:MAG: NAD-dependent epimerase/dehydratase [Parcubacteria group bacterium GW2011_GWC1_38_6]|uniref:NAD-dependent epimerase/dehydratase n=1 Tax=Candidatus Curtissbacteria bacterium GW2011_GWA1_41_11 TaxID=1618409 RepID=A0A0G0UKW1_9BACT|nr:MAG: NAD-dependent epimerase/dehydratase [Parcubacteria group bacterium GW2011_GWC1_38_6]KKR88151.1 MAG: NAD-dependent epimerase/dehydratase [Candidatus Curtissbacteria bacterium GW2011_GWA1_41_11]
MSKVILVTGGSGFIGSHICDQLIENDNTVICIDNLLTGSQKNIAHLLTKPNFHFFKQDACKPFKSKKFTKIDEIYHLASPADPNVNSPFSYMSHPFETMKVNTEGTWNLCELAVKHNSKFIFSSTSEIYGNPEKSPQDEQYRGNVSTTSPRSVYDESKRFGETIVSAFVREKRLDARITRIFNTYGPRMNLKEGRAVVNFIKQALSNEPITIYGDGKQTRSFCYIDDQVRGQIVSMNKGKTGEIFNIGNPDERSIIDFAEIIKRLTRSKSIIKFSQELPEDDPLQRKPDISKAKKNLGWEPLIGLEAGLEKTIRYFKNELNLR